MRMEDGISRILYCDYCGDPLNPASVHTSCFKEARDKFLQDEEDEKVNIELLTASFEEESNRDWGDEICVYCGDLITPTNSHFQCLNPLWGDEWDDLVDGDELLSEEISRHFEDRG